MEDTPEKVYFEPTQSIEHEVKSAPSQLPKEDVAKDVTENVSEDVSKDVKTDVTADVTADVTSQVLKDVTKDEKNDEDSSSDSGLKSECSKTVSHEYDSELTVEDEVEDITSSRIDVRCKDPTVEDKNSEMKSEVTNVSGATENVSPDVTTKENVETIVTKDVSTESKKLDPSVDAAPSELVESNVATLVTNVETKDDTLSLIADSKSECSSELNQQQVSFNQ